MLELEPGVGAGKQVSGQEVGEACCRRMSRKEVQRQEKMSQDAGVQEGVGRSGRG